MIVLRIYCFPVIRFPNYFNEVEKQMQLFLGGKSKVKFFMMTIVILIWFDSIILNKKQRFGWPSSFEFSVTQVINRQLGWI